jgi:hypothetical protein
VAAARRAPTDAGKVDQSREAAQWAFIGVMPTEQEWIERYGSHPEPLVINDGE